MKSGRQLGLLWGAVSVTLVAVSPLASRLASLLPACRFKALLGIPCPTCGSTRAALDLASFDLVGALVRYPLATVGWTLLIGGGLVAGIAALLGYGVPELPNRLSLAVKLGLLALFLANWAYLIATGV